MIIRLEDADGFLWESCLNNFRKQEKKGRNKKRKLAVFLETQDFTILGLLCMALFYANMFFKNLCAPRYAIELIVCIFVLGVIAFTSTDYWNIDYQEVDELKAVWKGIVNKTEAEKRKGQENT